MSELVTLDPPAIAGTRIQLDLTDWIGPEGPNWGDAAVEQYLADQEVGSLPVDYRIPNRRVSIPINLLDQAALTFEQIRTLIQQTTGLWQREGGWLARTITDAAGGTRTIYLDVVGASLHLGGGTLQALHGIDTDAVLELETLPDWYGDEIGDTTDTFGSSFPGTTWLYDTGSGTLSAAGGVLVPSSTAEKRIYMPDVEWYDQQVTIKFITPSVLGATWGVGCIVKRVDDRNYTFVQFDNANTIKVYTVTAGGAPVQVGGTSSSFTTAISTTYWFRGRIEGDKVTGELHTAAPGLGSAPRISVTTTFTSTNSRNFGLGIRGSPGLRLIPGSTSWTYDDAVVQPNVYVERSLSEVITAPIQGIEGNFPRGNRCRVKVHEAQGANQRGVIGAWRSRYYDSANTAALAFEAESLMPLDQASASALTGASGTAVRHPSLSTAWTPIVQLTLAGSNFLTHVGTYRLLARVYSAAGARVSMRAIYDVGDSINPSSNDAWTFPGASAFYIADLGEVRFERSPVGTHRWVGQIQGRTTASTDSVFIDRVFMVPVDEWMARATAIAGPNAGITSFPARDSFSQTAGALAGKTADVGGVWVGSGDADDVIVSGTGRATRTAVSDASPLLGRYLTLSSAVTDVEAHLYASSGDWDAGIIGAGTMVAGDKFGILLRHVDNNNWAFAGWTEKGIEALKCVAGVITSMGSAGNPGYDVFSAYAPYTTMDSDGFWTIGIEYFGPGGGVLQPLASGHDLDLASGGALASGRCGILDCRISAGAKTRFYDVFRVSANISDAAIYASQLAELRTDGLYRTDVSGTAYSKISVPYGRLPRIPCSGAEGQVVQGFFMTSRGDFDTYPDIAIDDTAVQVLWKPCYWFTPDN